MIETCTVCNTSLAEWSAVYCPHGRPFCGGCTWEDGCDRCDLAGAA